MTVTALRYRTYPWRGADEWLVEAGTGPVILMVPPLLEEMNRCRAMSTAVMRMLANRGFRTVMPDLPGTGESVRDLSVTRWEDWRGVIEGLTSALSIDGQAPVMACFRGGGLLTGSASPCWRFSPVAGAALTRDLIRAKQATTPVKTAMEHIEAQARSSQTELAGYELSASLFISLADALPPNVPGSRTVRLRSDPGNADLKLEGKPLWRQSEPGQDLDLADALAADIAAWRRSCAT